MEKYVVEGELGAGNYGACSLVRSKKSGTKFVVKRIELKEDTPSQRKEAENEVRAMSKLNHPNIVQFVEAFVEGKHLYIIMEYADNSDLERELTRCIKDKQYMTEDRIMNIFVQIALGLRQLHKQHLLHRDLKSANVFLTSGGAVKLGDFGFAKQLNYTMALASTVCGTPYYFSPELCQRLPYNNKSDVWSLGVILYEMINLQKPFEARNLPELRKRVVTEEPAPFTATHISPELKELCLMLLRKSSAARPSVDAVLQTPFVRRYLGKFAEQLNQQHAAQAEKVQVIAREHRRTAGEAPYEEVVKAQGTKTAAPAAAPAATAESVQSAGTGRIKLDRGEWQKFKKTGDDALLAGGTSKPQSSPGGTTITEREMLYNRELPDAHKVVSNNCPITVVEDLTNALIAEESCKALQTDVQEVLSSFDIDEAIGEAETDEERMLREQLGDKFVTVIQLALQLQALGGVGAEADGVYRKLLSTLGAKQYLLADVQRVASFFEVDDGSQ